MRIPFLATRSWLLPDGRSFRCFLLRKECAKFLRIPRYGTGVRMLSCPRSQPFAVDLQIVTGLGRELVFDLPNFFQQRVLVGLHRLTLP